VWFPNKEGNGDCARVCVVGIRDAVPDQPLIHSTRLGQSSRRIPSPRNRRPAENQNGGAYGIRTRMALGLQSVHPAFEQGFVERSGLLRFGY
jgi:hypothetical protein